MNPEFSPDNKIKLQEILTRYPTKQAALLPALWLAQGQFGFISQETMEYIAGLLGISPVHVFSVVTFYTMFHRQPVGRHHIQVCRTLSCALMGAEGISEHVKRRLKLKEAEVSADGKFSFCTVECLASCGTAPTMMVNKTYYENLTPGKVDEILDGLK